MIYVTSYQQLQDDHRRLRPDFLISILGPHDRLAWPQIGVPERRLRVECDDIQYPSSGYIVPTADHVSELIDFTKRWGGHGSLMVHCKAGTSRSPAAALIAMAVNGQGPEIDMAMASVSVKQLDRAGVGEGVSFDLVGGETDFRHSGLLLCPWTRCGHKLMGLPERGYGRMGGKSTDIPQKTGVFDA